MSYENAVPKVLKTLNSSGQVLDDVENVISDTTSYWEKKYNEAEPKPDKILKSDGSVVDSNGNQIQAANEYNVKKYNQAEPIPAKYLHADGTIDENPGGGGADLEDNHQTTIDVSTYTEPIEVEPASGKDGMKKNTVTLTNIPSGAIPSTEMPSWFDSLEDSVVPSGLQIVGVTRSLSDTIIIVGDGESTLTELLPRGKTFHEELVSYGESIVFAYDEVM